MPEMTKGAPEPESTGTATATAPDDAPQCEGKPCAECGWHHHGDRHYTRVGSRRWFWGKRIEHLMLWAVPGAPLLMGTLQLIAPSVSVGLDDKDQAAVNGAYDMPGGSASTVERVTVYLDQPGIGDRLVAAGPSLLFGVLLAFVAYALWRIEINLSATGKYTPKDGRVLRAATRWLWRGWWALMAAELTIVVWFRDAPASDHWWLASAQTPFHNASIMTLMIVAVVSIITRVYRSGAKAYAELEKGV